MHPLLVSLDLDFPGLKSVRAAYQAGDISLALNELVAYFWARPEPDAALLARPDPASLHVAAVALRHEFGARVQNVLRDDEMGNRCRQIRSFWPGTIVAQTGSFSNSPTAVGASPG